MDRDILLLIVGGAITILSSFLTTGFNKFLDNSGSFKGYCRIVNSIDGNPFGVAHSNNGHLYIRLPMWIDLFNTSNKARFIRDFNIIAVDNNDKEIASFGQIQATNLHKDSQYDYGNNQMYSLIVSPRGVARYNCLFIIDQEDEQIRGKQICSLNVKYYDEKDRKITKKIYEFDNPDIWKPQAFNYKNEWIKI